MPESWYQQHWLWDIDDVCITTKLHPLREWLKRVRTDLPSLLITGIPSIGKSTVALWLVRSLYCERPQVCKQLSGCCDQCRGLWIGAHPDCCCIDNPSIGIEDIRTIKEAMSLSSLNNRGRVVIIPNAHHLSIEALNGLLKILEEPPSNVRFILCTPSRSLLPTTIVSRLPHIRLPRVDNQYFRNWCKSHFKQEYTHLAYGAPGLYVRMVNDPEYYTEFTNQNNEVLKKLGGPIRPWELFDTIRSTDHITEQLQQWSIILHESLLTCSSDEILGKLHILQSIEYSIRQCSHHSSFDSITNYVITSSRA